MFCSALSDQASIDRCGGKAAHLARARALGVSTPRTVVLEREGLRQFLTQSGLEVRVEAWLAGTAPEKGAAALEAEHRDLTAEMRKAPFPAALRAEVVHAARELLADAPRGLAVRSSAVYEDSAAASFAGVFESYVEVATENEVVERVLDVWSSSWSPRALRYLARMGIEPQIDAMAVLLQPVLPADNAGVIHTADPDTGNPWEFVMRAARGLSVDLLSGSGKGDDYRVGWENGEILTSEHASEPVLKATDVAAVAAVARRLDEAFDDRLDIEWLTVDGAVTVVQARPLTALPEFFPAEIADGDRNVTWHRAPFLIGLRTDHPPNLVTPFYADMSETENWFRYQPEDIVLTGSRNEERDYLGHRWVDAVPPQTFLDFFDGPAEFEPWLDANEARYRERWDRRHDELRTIEDAAASALATATTAAELIPVLLDVRDRLWDLNSFGWSGPQALGWMCEGLLELIGKSVDPDFRCETVVHGGATSHTHLVTHQLQEFGRSIDESAVREAFEQRPLAEVMPHLQAARPDCAFLKEWEALCWRICRTPPSWEGRPPFWTVSEPAATAMHTVRAAMLGTARDVVEVQRTSAAARQRAEQDLLERAETPEHRRRLAVVIGWTRYWTCALNDRHGVAVGLLWERELIWRTGERLRDEGIVDAPADVLLLYRGDLEAMATGAGAHRDLFVRRQREYLRHRRLRAPETLGAAREPAAQPAAPETAAAPTANEPGVFAGTCSAGGSTTGVARPVSAVNDPGLLDTLTTDDILVLPHGDAFPYADWHSLLTLVRGVVSPGRPAHHLAQVARECRVPVLGHVQGDLTDVPNGARVELNASAGWFRVLPPAQP